MKKTNIFQGAIYSTKRGFRKVIYRGPETRGYQFPSFVEVLKGFGFKKEKRRNTGKNF